MKFKTKVLSTLLFSLLSHSALAFDTFEIRDIRLEGLQRTEPGTVFSYLPVQVGDTMTNDIATQSIKTLYGTGFFKDVRIETEGDVLVVVVQERSAIAQISFQGNSSFPSDKMKEGLVQIGISEGLVFDKSELDRAEQEIKKQYLSQGKYGAVVKTVVTPMERNRVGVKFEITEGKVAKIKDINIVGNHVFTTDDLRAEFLLTTPNWMSWWNKDDQYSKQKLTADLETLKSFYLNQGYLEFAIDSTQISISPDKQDVFITVNITEGEKYTVSDIKLAGQLELPVEELTKLITLYKGDVFSRSKVSQTTKAIGDRLSEEGFAFSNVNAIPEIDAENHTAAFTFFIDPGKKVYVRRINVTGNTRTKDNVIRRELRQLESAWYAGSKIKRSKQRLERLQFFDTVDFETPAVPGSNDQVDLNVRVAEKSTGSVQFGAGVSSNDGVVFGFNINQPNFLGTGNRVNIQLNTSSVNTVYSLSYTDPYFTPDGISRGFDIYRRDVDTGSNNTRNIGTYQSSSYGGGVRFGVPLSENDFLSFGLSADYTKIDLTADSPLQYRDFCGNNTGCSNGSVLMNLAWTFDSRDNTLFPKRGVLQRLSAEATIPGLDLEYYKINYKHAWFKELNQDFSIMLNGELGYAASYGSNPYPFYKNFYLGGVNSVRGYANGSLGPQQTDSVTNQEFSVGGTKKVLGNIELFMPIPFVTETKQFRLSSFIDGGAIYLDDQSVTADELRYSVGLGLTWISPFGPLKIVYAKALNEEDTDDTETIQFQLGQQF